MNEREQQEIIALSEDPEVSFEETPGRPPTAEEREWVADLADSLFDQCSLAEKVEELSDLPVDIALRRIARQTPGDQAKILSRLPADLALAVGSLLPSGVA